MTTNSLDRYNQEKRIPTFPTLDQLNQLGLLGAFGDMINADIASLSAEWLVQLLEREISRCHDKRPAVRLRSPGCAIRRWQVVRGLDRDLFQKLAIGA